MDRVVSVGCKSWLWVVMLCGGCPTRVSEETPAASCSALPHTGDRIGASLRLGTDQSSWLTRADVAVGSFASKVAEAVRTCTSAILLTADVNSPPWLPPLSAMTRLMHRRKNGHARHARFALIAPEVRCRGEATRLVPQTRTYWIPLNRVASVDDFICSHQHCCRYFQPESFARTL